MKKIIETLLSRAGFSFDTPAQIYFQVQQQQPSPTCNASISPEKLLFCILFRNFFVLFQKNPRMIRASNYLNKRDEQKTQKSF